MTDTKRDYYDVLGLGRDADQKAIKDAFRRLAMKYHPDRNKSPEAEERFKEIAEAYGMLSDPKKKADYDAHGFAGVADVSVEDLFGGINFDDIFGGLGFDFNFGGGGGLFDRFFRRSQTGPIKGQDRETHLLIPLEQVNTGGKATVQLQRLVECPACHGSGAKFGSQAKSCDVCGGSGQKVVRQQKGGVSLQQISTCPKCHGAGNIIEHPCPECNGHGNVQKLEKLKVTIPIGVEEGMVLRVHGHGLPSPQAGGTPGDLYVIVHTAEDPRFQREHGNLWREERIEVTDAVLGTKIKVPTLEGMVEVKVPPSTQHNEVLRLKGKGLQHFDGGGRGDLMVRIDVHVPEQLSDDQRRLYQQLRELEKSG